MLRHDAWVSLWWWWSSTSTLLLLLLVVVLLLLHGCRWVLLIRLGWQTGGAWRLGSERRLWMTRSGRKRR